MGKRLRVIHFNRTTGARTCLLLGAAMCMAKPTLAKTFLGAQLDQLQSLKNTSALVDVKTHAVVSQASAHTLVTQLRTNPDGFSVIYPWAYAVPAAAFYHGAHMWVVFGAPITVTSDTRQPISSRGAPTGMMVVPNARATIIGYSIKPSQAYTLERTGTAWRLDVKKQDMAPRFNMTPEHKADAIRGEELLFRTTDASTPVSFRSQDNQDDVMVAPLYQGGHGVNTPLSFNGATLLSSAQGIAVATANPHVELLKLDEGIAVADLSNTLDVPKVDTSRTDRPRSKLGLISVQSLKAQTPEAYIREKQKLWFELSVAPANERQGKRWQLARFFLANTMPHETLAALGALLKFDHDLVNTPQFRAMRGIAYLEAHQFASAEDDLKPVYLDGEPEIWLWRSLLHARTGQHQWALDAFNKGASVAGFMATPERLQFQFSAIDAALNIGDVTFAAKEVSLLPIRDMNAQDTAHTEYCRGRLLTLNHKLAEANVHFLHVQSTGDRQSAARATLALVQNNLLLKTMPAEAAIARLERLRFAWRNSDFELDLLDTLASLYVQSHKYREALSAYRQATQYFPNSDRVQAMAVKMDGLFHQLFLNNLASDLPPVAALALYNDFQMLTPLGDDGDRMIRQIANRLVDVKLYGRAAGLLQHQVKYRLEGTAQAGVATRLAMINVLDHHPEKAIDALRATRQQALPDDVRAERNLIEARALTDLDKGDEAAILIEHDHSYTADTIRSDIAWHNKGWKTVVSLSQKLLSGAKTGDAEKHIMRMAFAYTMLGDTAGASQLRTRYSASVAATRYSSAFQLLTSGNVIGMAEINSISAALASLDMLDGAQSYTLAAYKALKT